MILKNYEILWLKTTYNCHKDLHVIHLQLLLKVAWKSTESENLKTTICQCVTVNATCQHIKLSSSCLGIWISGAQKLSSLEPGPCQVSVALKVISNDSQEITGNKVKDIQDWTQYENHSNSRDKRKQGQRHLNLDFTWKP